ncbi:MAG: ATP-dependent helicase [Saprospiraceae bacterium]|nr:ATP-dependent helicase [Saprospiraceae bacterium]
MPFFNAALFESKPELLRGNLQIIACAGSGKTEFVSERIAYLLYKKVARPEQIVAFTFTEKAAEELKFRVRSKIQELLGKQPDIGDMYIGTIHAFAFKILQDFIPKYRAYDMLDEVGRLAFLSSIKRDLDFEQLGDSLSKRYKKPFGKNMQNWVYHTFIKDVDLFREEGLTEGATLSDSFRNAYKVYSQKLEEKRFLDFSSILRIAVDTLENEPSVRKKLQNQYSFFTVDEYQDVNPIQEILIQLISGKQNVCVVGDDDQSIYQFRGADVQNIITFQNRYPKAAIHQLDINRRSHDGIVKTGDELIKRNNPRRLPKSIKDKGVTSEAGDLYKVLFERQEEEIEWIVLKVKALVGKEYLDGTHVRKLKYSDFAFLFRSIRNEAAPYINALRAADIPVVYAGTGGLFDTPEVGSILKIFSFISECDRDVDYDDAFLQDIHDNLPADFSITFKKLKAALCAIQEDTKAQKRLSLQGLYAHVLSLLGISDESFHEAEDDVLLFNLGRLSQAIADYEGSREYLTFNSLKDFIWFIRLHAENAYDSGKTDAMAGLIDAVQILTMHGTKGLGFPVVFMPSHFRRNREPDFGATLLDITKFDSDRFLNHVEDERRIYYVGITRAKKFLFVTSAILKVGGKNRASRSSFFDEIPSTHFITKEVADPTKRKPCKIEGVSEEARFPTSYSELAYYLNCGYDYKMRFIYGFNPELVPALGFGKQVHNVINLLHKDYEDTGKIPGKTKIAKIIEEHFYLRYASDAVTERLKVGAMKSLAKYVQMWEKDFSLSVKTERPFELEFDNALIAGSIDMIKRQDGNETVLEVIDFKTGKPDNDLMHRYELQVQLYTIAAQEALGINTQKALIHFIDTDKNERLAVQTSPAALETAKEELSFALEGITKATFRRDARQDKICKSCDWCTMCPKRKGYRA